MSKDPNPKNRTLATAVGIGTALFLLAFLSPVIYPIDGNSMLAVAISLVTKGNFTVPSGMGSIGIDGAYYSDWYPLLSILGTPLVAIAVSVAHLKHLPIFYTAGAFALVLSPLFTAATAYFVVALALRLGSSQRGAVLAAVAFIFGTIAMVYSRDFFAEPLLALITAAAIYRQLGDVNERRIASLLAALAVLAKPTGIILGPLLAAHAGLRDRSAKAMCLPVVGAIAGFAIYALYNTVRFGDPLNFGQPNAFRLSNVPGGISVLMLSPGRGLIWYCPVVLALFGLDRRIVRRLDVALIFAVALAYLFVYSLWSLSSGGWCWGPRFLLPALPGLLALTAFLKNGWRRCLVVLTIAGFLVSSPTLVSYYYRIYQEEIQARENSYDLWSFSQAPFIKVLGSTSRELRDARDTDVRMLVRQSGKPSNNQPENWRTLRIVNLWWWMLPILGIPRILGAAISAMLTLVGLSLITWATWRATYVEAEDSSG